MAAANMGGLFPPTWVGSFPTNMGGLFPPTWVGAFLSGIFHEALTWVGAFL